MNRFTSLIERSTSPWELWLLRLLWLILPLVAGPGLGSTLDGVDQPARTILEAAAWVSWFGGLVACLAPQPVSLTMIRVLAPSVVGTAVLALTATTDRTAVLTAAGFGLVLTAVSLLPAIGDAMVNGSAYGSERRMALRPPGPTLFGPLQLAWLTVFLGIVGWAVALMSGRSLLAGVAAAAGAGLAWTGWRILHQLSRRWVVFVPAGFVLHDLMQLRDPVLIQRSSVSSVGPSPADTPDDLLDLSAASMGLALEVETRKPVTFDRRNRSDIETVSSSNIRFSPTLPGAVLTEARIRGLRIGEATRQPM